MAAAMDIRDELASAGWTDLRVSETATEADKDKAHRDAKKGNGGLFSLKMLKEMLACINPGIGRKESSSWISVLGALKYAEACELVCIPDTFEPDPNFDAEAVAVEWSRGDYWKNGQPANFVNEADVSKNFAGLSPFAAKGSTIASIVRMAYDGGYCGRSRIDDMMDRFDLECVEPSESTVPAAKSDEPESEDRITAMASKLRATAFKWEDPVKLPARKFLLGADYIEGYVSATVAAPGIGKTAHEIAEAVMLASGKPILGEGFELWEGSHKCWLINLEDPNEELQARSAAAVLKWNEDHPEDAIDPATLEARLFLDGNATEMVTAVTTSNGVTICEPVMAKIEEQVTTHGIKVIIVDPFISSHAVPENDNPAVDRVVKRWARLASKHKISVMLVHHSRKMQPGQEEITAESARGASSFSGAVRKVRLLSPMPVKTAKRFGVTARRKTFYGVLDGGKANPTPDLDSVRWFGKSAVHIGNGDRYGYVAVTPWTPPVASKNTVEEQQAIYDAIEAGTAHEGKPSKWMVNEQAKGRWAGHAVAKALDLSVEDEANRITIRQRLAQLMNAGILIEVREKDMAGNRAEKLFIAAGKRPDDLIENLGEHDEDFGNGE